MALGSENQQFPGQQQQILTTRAINHHQRPIAPAPATMAHAYTASPYSKPTATMQSSYAGTTLDSNNPSVVRRNARERNRVKQVNNGFVHLRQHIPQAIVADLSNGRRGIGPGASKKLSKVDTLKMALEYIRRLQRVIEDVDSGSDTSSVSSYSGSNSSISGSPPPLMSSGNTSYYQTPQQQHFYPVSYAGSFPAQQQQQYQSSAMNSPAASTSSAYSTDSYYQQSPTTAAAVSDTAAAAPPVQVKFEQSFDEFAGSPNAEDDEILEYISLWQEDM